MSTRVPRRPLASTHDHPMTSFEVRLLENFEQHGSRLSSFEVRLLENFCRRHEADDGRYRRAVKTLMDIAATQRQGENFCQRYEVNDVKYRRAARALTDNEATIAHTLALADADCPPESTS